MGHQFSSTIPTRRQYNKYEISNVMIRVKICDFVVKNSSTHFHDTKFTIRCSRYNVHGMMFTTRRSRHDVYDTMFTAGCLRHDVSITDVADTTCAR